MSIDAGDLKTVAIATIGNNAETYLKGVNYLFRKLSQIDEPDSYNQAPARPRSTSVPWRYR
jgi:hypothetical protein